ncbi:MAG: methyltransferase domain-containing protein [bacterium]|nr:methyltransferase domain-containing protein [bacterium]
MEKPAFSFGDQSVAAAYDDILVPILFEPWAARLVDEFRPWNGLCVLDLATGTGIVAAELAKHVGPEGKVIGADINAEMLSLARHRCTGARSPVEFIESPAHPLAIPDESVDVVVCQQGFQFFPDKSAAAEEMARVLRKRGKVILATWRPVAECEFFGKVCEALESIDEAELTHSMRVPFDFMPESELSQHFEATGFQGVRITQERLPFTVDGGMRHALEAAYSTPIGPRLRGLPEETQLGFRETLTTLLANLSSDGTTMGRMVSNVLCADAPS